MPAFLKSPKFIAGAILVLWLAYVLYANFQGVAVEFRILPFGLAVIYLRLSGVVISSIVFGAALAVVVQFMWRRTPSNPAPK